LSQAFNQKIKELLEEHGVSQAELSKRLGVSQPTVSYLLKPHGRRTQRPHPFDFYQQLVQSFGLELSDVLREIEARVRAAQGPRRTRMEPRRRASAISRSGAQPSLLVSHTALDSELRQHLQRQLELLHELHLQRQLTARGRSRR
jgi:transcriptional regulator with XRE-family HTH domain